MRASEFVQFLVQLGGIEQLRELATLTQFETSFSQWRPQLESVYGMLWEDVWAAYIDSPECESKTMHDDVLLCYTGLGAVANLTPGLMEPPREYTHEMSCDDPRVIGPVNGDELRHEVLVEFDEGSIHTVWIKVTGDLVDGSYATLTRCGTCSGEDSIVLTSNSTNSIPLIVNSEGVYVLEQACVENVLLNTRVDPN